MHSPYQQLVLHLKLKQGSCTLVDADKGKGGSSWYLVYGIGSHIRSRSVCVGFGCRGNGYVAWCWSVSVFCLFPLSLSSLLSHTREETVSVWSTIFSLTRNVIVTGGRCRGRKKVSKDGRWSTVRSIIVFIADVWRPTQSG